MPPSPENCAKSTYDNYLLRCENDVVLVKGMLILHSYSRLTSVPSAAREHRLEVYPITICYSLVILHVRWNVIFVLRNLVFG